MANVIRRFFGDADLLEGIDPTRLCLGDDADFDTQPFDHSLDDIDGGSILRILRKTLRRPGGREEIAALARAVVLSETNEGF